MKTFNNSLRAMVAILALTFATTAGAVVPSIDFDGPVSYTPSSGLLQVNANVTALNGIPALQIPGTLVLDAYFAGYLATTPMVLGNFTGMAGDELLVTDASGLLLSADLDSLVVGGTVGDDNGFMTGFFSATGGSRAGEFGVSKLFTLVLNFADSVVFTTDMFSNRDWTAQVDGDLTSVPEPGILALLSLGLGLISLRVRRKGTAV